eukprot:TRINITY_DN66845_c5_g8_i1.p1 TRINITY_DN66845_c5_g8~~TRINITY_DN66845_c5_g8_i1.p1  ORF type:complete len:477 (+),score=20.70 TRINITY_DN66845_c5_g8_i1:50-1480(+)
MHHTQLLSIVLLLSIPLQINAERTLLSPKCQLHENRKLIPRRGEESYTFLTSSVKYNYYLAPNDTIRRHTSWPPTKNDGAIVFSHPNLVTRPVAVCGNILLFAFYNNFDGNDVLMTYNEITDHVTSLGELRVHSPSGFLQEPQCLDEKNGAFLFLDGTDIWIINNEQPPYKVATEVESPTPPLTDGRGTFFLVSVHPAIVYVFTLQHETADKFYPPGEFCIPATVFGGELVVTVSRRSTPSATYDHGHRMYVLTEGQFKPWQMKKDWITALYGSMQTANGVTIAPDSNALVLRGHPRMEAYSLRKAKLDPLTKLPAVTSRRGVMVDVELFDTSLWMIQLVVTDPNEHRPGYPLIRTDGTKAGTYELAPGLGPWPLSKLHCGKTLFFFAVSMTSKQIDVYHTDGKNTATMVPDSHQDFVGWDRFEGTCIQDGVASFRNKTGVWVLTRDQIYKLDDSSCHESVSMREWKIPLVTRSRV